jgi:hypothetical protein
MLLQSVVPFPRTWIYLLVIIAVWASWLPAQVFQPLRVGQNAAALTPNIAVLMAVGIWCFSTYDNIIEYKQTYNLFFSYGKAYNQISLSANSKPLIVDTDNGDVMMQYQYLMHKKLYLPLRHFSVDSLPPQVLLVHDKVAQPSSYLYAAPKGQYNVLYEDSFVSVSEVTISALNPQNVRTNL